MWYDFKMSKVRFLRIWCGFLFTVEDMLLWCMEKVLASIESNSEYANELEEKIQQERDKTEEKAE